jgi:hypothetical protein
LALLVIAGVLIVATVVGVGVMGTLVRLSGSVGSDSLEVEVRGLSSRPPCAVSAVEDDSKLPETVLFVCRLRRAGVRSSKLLSQAASIDGFGLLATWRPSTIAE